MRKIISHVILIVVGIVLSGIPLVSFAQISVSAKSAVNSALTDGANNSIEMQTRVKTLISSDAKLNSVSVSPEEVSMTYREPAKLLGFIGIYVPVEATISANGKASVYYPWYSFFFETNQAGLSIEAQGIANEVMSTAATSSTGIFSLGTQAQLLASLHHMLASSSDE